MSGGKEPGIIPNDRILFRETQFTREISDTNHSLGYGRWRVLKTVKRLFSSVKVKLIVTITAFLFLSTTALGTISYNYAVGNFEKLLQGRGVGLYNQTLHANANQLLIAMLITIVAELIIGGVSAYWIAIQITRPILQILSGVERVSAGNLHSAKLVVKQSDEIGRLASGFNEMTESLVNVIRHAMLVSQQLSDSSSQLSVSAGESAHAAEQVTLTIQEIASGTDNQAHSVEKSHRAILQITNNMAHIVKNAEKVTISAEDASRKADKGTHSVADARKQVHKIGETASQLTEIGARLAKRSNEVEHIVEMIAGITKQTNLLALNAAIEAARAGESGQSFSVVANEVRQLAVQCADSAKQIEALIHQIQCETGQMVDFILEFRDQIIHGQTTMADAENAFGEIQLAVKVASTQIREVNEAVQNISHGTQQLTLEFDQVSTVTEQTATGMQSISAASEEQLATVEEIAASSTSLAQIAEQLQQAIGKFVL